MSKCCLNTSDRSIYENSSFGAFSCTLLGPSGATHLAATGPAGAASNRGLIFCQVMATQEIRSPLLPPLRALGDLCGKSFPCPKIVIESDHAMR